MCLWSIKPVFCFAARHFPDDGALHSLENSNPKSPDWLYEMGWNLICWSNKVEWNIYSYIWCPLKMPRIKTLMCGTVRHVVLEYSTWVNTISYVPSLLEGSEVAEDLLSLVPVHGGRSLLLAASEDLLFGLGSCGTQTQSTVHEGVWNTPLVLIVGLEYTHTTSCFTHTLTKCHFQVKSFKSSPHWMLNWREINSEKLLSWWIFCLKVFK